MPLDDPYVIPYWLLKPPSIATRDDIAATSRSNAKSQMTVAALDALLPVPYGLNVRLPGLLANALVYNGSWLFWVIWGEGPVAAFLEVTMNDEALPAGASATNYLGTAAGNLDATLAAAFAANGISGFAETLPYVSHSVITMPFDQVTTTPRFHARQTGIQAQELYEAQRNLLSYSNTFSNAFWTKTATLGSLVAAIDGLPTAQTLQDTGTNWQYCGRTLTVANDSSAYVASVYVKKTSGGTAATFGVNFYLSGGGPTTYARLNTDTGAINVSSDVSVVDYGTYWRLIVKVANNSSGKTSLAFEMYPAAGAYQTSPAQANDNSSTSGSAVICWAQVEKASAVSDYQPIATTYGAATTPFSTENPARIFADFLQNTRWGAGKSLVSHSVATCAAYNDVVLGTAPNTEVSRTCNILIDREAKLEQWVETLRTAAACFLVENQGQVKLIPDADLPLVNSYSHSAGEIIGIGAPELADASELPTVLAVTYTDTSVLPWKDATTDPVKRPGVDAGTVPWRKSIVDMRWVTRPSQASREAVERLNKLWLRSLHFPLQLFDEGLRHEPGDLIGVTFPDAGFATLPVRVLVAIPNANGWLLNCEKHDTGAYSATVQANPSTPNTDLPLPSSPPAMGAITATEDVYQVQTGYYSSRIVVTWSAQSWPFLDNYLITITQAGVVKDSGLAARDATRWVSKALTENLTYIVSVAVVSSSGAIGTAMLASVATTGKSAIPSDVPSFSGYEISGTVFLNWALPSDLDLTACEIRYGAVGVSWANATLLDRIAFPGIRYETARVGPGATDFLIKGLDSVRSASYPNGQESANAARITITLTSDASTFIAANTAFGSATLKNMTLSGGLYVTDFAQTWDALFQSTMSGYTNALYTYHTSGDSGLWTNIVDLGLAITGDFSSTMTYSELAGVGASLYLQLASGGEATKAITGATNASPIVITATAHGYNIGDEVVIAGVGGNTAANGRWIVGSASFATDTFSLVDFAGANVAGNGTYTSGGTASRWMWSDYAAGGSVKKTARYVRSRIGTTGAGTLVVSDLGRMQVNVVSRPDGGFGTTPNTTDPAIVSFNSAFTLMKTIQVTASGSSGRSVSYDQIEVSGGGGLQAGRTLRLDGTSQYVYSGSINLGIGSSLTVELWFKPDSDFYGSARQLWTIPCDAYTTDFGLRFTAAGKLSLFYNSTNNLCRLNGVDVYGPPVGVWSHLAVVVDNANSAVIFYLNGVEVGRGYQGYLNPTNTSARVVTVGATGAAANKAKGVVDEFRVWNEARSAANILANYQAAASAGGNLELLWHFDETTGSNAADASGNSYTGTLAGANNNQWRPYDGFDAYVFDGSGTKVAAPFAWSAEGA